jgi:hypothetical protein
VGSQTRQYLSESALVLDRVEIGCVRIAVMATIGLIGAGYIGSQIARLAIASGYNVVISNSRERRKLQGLGSHPG